ncbi:MAG: Crp/Fnr family transcriptional regulator [Firmicutes bacterium HGW-Firmicutes-12]|jgi:CRP-like cAMP-binding protein|nr:MAG: Crp/Fnr family transcriptional regulator [Firmicutes bacterium HGW-Firmicutes-12]
MREYIKTLEQSNIFFGIKNVDIEEMIVCLQARQREYKKCEMVIWEGSVVTEIGIILSGKARSIKEGISGKTVIVTLLEEGDFIGVLLAASHERKSPVSVQALDHLSVMFLPIERVLGRCAKVCRRHDLLLCNYLDGIAEKALVLHDRNDCLIKTTVREKILTYLTREAKDKDSINFTIPLDREALAEYLNVERSALSRELSRMKKDGLIDYYKSDFRLFYQVALKNQNY